MPLSALLDDVRHRFAPSHREGLTNHMPMAAIALDRIGATEERVRAFIEHHASELEPARPWPRADEMAADLRARGVDFVLREHLRRDLRGLAGGAFHGAIRLAYATMAKDIGEMAAGLAYLHESALVLESGAERERRAAFTGTTELAVLVERLRVAGIEKPTGPNITVRLEQVVADARFSAVIDDLAVDKTTLAQVSGLGARWYLAADDFVSLHVLTGAHAVRTLRPWTADATIVDRALTIGALAAYVACGSPARFDARGKPRADDRELKRSAIESNDDHMAKLVVAALDEEAACEDAIYRIAATRAVRRGNT